MPGRLHAGLRAARDGNLRRALGVAVDQQHVPPGPGEADRQLHGRITLRTTRRYTSQQMRTRKLTLLDRFEGPIG